MDLVDCFDMVREMATQAFIQDHVIEGVRTLIVDKDNLPHWRVRDSDGGRSAGLDRSCRQVGRCATIEPASVGIDIMVSTTST